ncbi:MAG: insulinase family protein [Campylobacteraceae bacterium]|nr:insulinase family protein [Campylobacteraceae bacterium]
MKIEYIDIKNIAIPLLYKFDNSMPVVNFKLVFKASGSVRDADKAGLAKLTAKLLNEGTKTHGVSEFSKALEIKAIELYAGCGFETFTIEINCLKEHFEYALGLLESLLSDPNLTESTLEKIKTIAKGELATKENDFDYQAKEELEKILFANTPLANKMSYESVDSISLDDIKNFLNELSLSNLYIVLAGDVSSDINLSKTLDALNSGIKTELEVYKTSFDEITKFVKKESEQAYIYFGAPYNVPKDERYLSSVATFILGSSGFGSRLMEEIRVKRGLAYSIYARSSFNLSSSSIWGYMQTKNENKEEAISVIKDEFLKFVRDGVSEEELKGAKNFLLGSVPLQKETMFQRVYIKEQEFYQGLEFGEFERNLERVKNLDLKTLNEFIKSHDEILKLSFAVIYNE